MNDSTDLNKIISVIQTLTEENKILKDEINTLKQNLGSAKLKFYMDEFNCSMNKVEYLKTHDFDFDVRSQLLNNFNKINFECFKYMIEYYDTNNLWHEYVVMRNLA